MPSALARILLTPDGGAPEGGAGTPPVTPPTVELKTEGVTLTRAEYDELMAAKTLAGASQSKVADLEKKWGHAQRLLRTDTDPKAAQESLRVVMAETGYTPEQIEAYLAEQAGEPEQAPAKGQGQGKGRGAPAEPDPEVVQLRETVATQGATVSALRKNQLESMVQVSIKTAVDTNKELATLIETLAGFSDEEGGQAGVDEARSTIAAEVHRDTLDRLRERRARESQANGRDTWNDAWIADEAVKAAKAAHTKFKRFVPDPSKLGRAPDAEAWVDEIKDAAPVKAPTFTKGSAKSDVRKGMKDWAVDHLLRGVAETSAGPNRA